MALDGVVHTSLKADTTARALFFSTVRIVGTSAEDADFYTEGTGFLYDASRTPGVPAPTLVTARHVIEGATELTLRFIAKRPDGEADLGKYEEWTIPGGADAFTPHPNPQIDVAVYRLAGALMLMDRDGKAIYAVSLSDAHCPSDEALEEIDAIEEVFFVGYPDGQYDRVNQTPVARRAATATPIQLDWSGAPQFLVDAPIFTGSSGSPVVLVRPATHPNTPGSRLAQQRVVFLGVLTHSVQTPAEVRQKGRSKPEVEVRIGLSLGVVEKWTAVEETLDAMCAAEGLDRAALVPNRLAPDFDDATSMEAD